MALQDAYAFLNSYLSKISGTTENPDDRPLEDENDFYDVPSEDDQNTNDDAGYGIDSDDNGNGNGNGDDEYGMGEDTDTSDDNGNGNGNGDDEYGMGEDTDTSDDYEGYPFMGFNTGYSNNTPVSGSDTGGLGKSIASTESQGKYTATNKHSTATGKYQFLWSAWGNSIKQITGVKSRDEFLHNPKAQDEYYNWYEKNYLMPQVDKIRPYNKSGLSDQQLAKLVHFRGAAGAKKYLQGQLPDQPEKYNVPISKYIAQHQAGGHGVAMSAGAKSMGLNNSSFSTMSFPMDGINEFRGLDDGTPVELIDETGRKKVLKGKKHKTVMYGNVFEKRLK